MALAKGFSYTVSYNDNGDSLWSLAAKVLEVRVKRKEEENRIIRYHKLDEKLCEEDGLGHYESHYYKKCFQEEKVYMEDMTYLIGGIYKERHCCHRDNWSIILDLSSQPDQVYIFDLEKIIDDESKILEINEETSALLKKICSAEFYDFIMDCVG